MNRSVALRGGAVLSMLLGFVPGLLFLVIGFVGGVYVDQRFPEYVPFIGHRSASNVDLSQVQEAESRATAAKQAQAEAGGL